MSSATAPTTGLALRTRIHEWVRRVDSPVTSYLLLRIITVALVVFGLIMVLSASAYDAQRKYGSPYAVFSKQCLYAVLGTVALLGASRVSATTWKRLALPIMLGAIVMQALVFTPLGNDVNGNRNWLLLGGFSMQPSELSKIGLALAGAAILARKQKLLHRPGHAVVPYIFPVALLSIFLVLAGHDLGTVLVLLAIVAAVLWTCGVTWKLFAGAFAAFGVLVGYMVMTSSNRLGRLDVWLGRDTDIYGAARQPIHGRFALADGGWLGLGLGQSREKWGLLSEPHNDFIFAIIGEELGIIGTLVVLALYCALALVCLRIVRRSDDLFVRLAVSGIMTWIVFQAMVNIGAVIGLLPVIGVPLPLVSAGGSSLMTTMAAMGVLMSFARHEPGARQVLAARPGALRRSLSVLSTRRSRS